MKKILITGAGTGLGKAAALALARKGHHVYATTVDEAQADQMDALGRTEGLRLEGFKLDVTLEADRQKIAALELDVLLNNAGVGYSGSLAEIDVDTVRKNFEINVFGAIRLTQVALRGMIARKRGTVMFVSSIAGRITAPFLGSVQHRLQQMDHAEQVRLDGERQLLRGQGRVHEGA